MSGEIPNLIPYPRPARRYHQAHQVWPILCAWARFRTVGKVGRPGIISYGELAELLGYKPNAGRTLAHALGMIEALCAHNELPRLNEIVVDVETGKAGRGIPKTYSESQESMKAQVIDFDWFAYRTPTLRTFRDFF